MEEIKLSILIPLYNYKKGVDNILNCLKEIDPCKKNYLEIIISDDSENKIIENQKMKYFEKLFKHFYYFHNKKSLGGAGNWNKLISLAKGRYFWILHHDEYWDKKIDIVKYLLNTIEEKKPNIIFLPLIKEKTIKIKNQKIILFQENKFSNNMVNRFIKNPYLFLKVNILGPPSVLIYKKCNLVYDKKLFYFIDVDFYIRLIEHYKSSNIFFNRYKNIYLLSSQDNRNSITKVIKKKINSIKRKEIFILRKKYSSRLSMKDYFFLISNYINFKIISILSIRSKFVSDD